MKQPGQRILVVIGEEDIICRRCPKRSNCQTLHPEKSPLFGTAFYKEDYLREEKDKTIATDYEVKDKCEYSTREIFPEILMRE